MKVKIAYFITVLYWLSGMERVFTLKSNYFANIVGYEYHINRWEKHICKSFEVYQETHCPAMAELI
ncbi:MAG: hypothetical protein PHP29_04255 [Tissierellia bacterium]|nr:hypothetical protein [Tissierellia bacterium]